jgi:RNA polymerase sigma-70 factor (ECF subfamily)
LDEAELIGAAKGGDREAFDELVRRTFVDTFTLARRLTGNEEDARDVVQEAYLRAWKGIGKFRGEAAFSTWLYRITANTASTHIHRRRRQRAEPFAEGFEPVDARAEEQVSQAAESADTLDRISHALDELPPKLRSVVLLKDVYDLSHEEIADELGISVSAAKVRLHRGRRKLRDVLYDEGAEADAV